MPPGREKKVSNRKKEKVMNLSIVSKVVEVDNLLKFANDRKDDLDFRRIVLNREKKGMSSTVENIDTELVKVTAKLAASNAIVGLLTDPEDIRDENLRRDRLDVRRKGLENRRMDANIEALIMLEFELEDLTVRIAKVDELIAALNARKTEIEAAQNENQ
jgi:hypothetical protein